MSDDDAPARPDFRFLADALSAAAEEVDKHHANLCRMSHTSIPEAERDAATLRDMAARYRWRAK